MLWIVTDLADVPEIVTSEAPGPALNQPHVFDNEQAAVEYLCEVLDKRLEALKGLRRRIKSAMKLRESF